MALRSRLQRGPVELEATPALVTVAVILIIAFPAVVYLVRRKTGVANAMLKKLVRSTFLSVASLLIEVVDVLSDVFVCVNAATGRRCHQNSFFSFSFLRFAFF